MTGLHDVRGIPIRVGDLIRIPHYRHYLRGQQMWLYFVVEMLDGKPVLYQWRNPKTHQCLATAETIKGCEIVAESGPHRLPDGSIETWNERPRLQKERA